MSEHTDLRSWTSDLHTTPAGPSLLADHPELDEIERTALDTAVRWAAVHAERYILTGGAADGWTGPRPILLLYTVGRRSGAWRRNPLLYAEHDGEAYVVASKGGAPENPAWYLNLVEQPAVHLRIDARFGPADAHVLDPAEREAVWPALTQRYPMWSEYQELTDRPIPVIRLRRRT